MRKHRNYYSDDVEAAGVEQVAWAPLLYAKGAAGVRA